MRILFFRHQTLACHAVAFLLSSAALAGPGIDEALKKKYDDARALRLAKQYNDPFPEVEENLLWGTLNKTIAAIATGRAVDEALVLRAIEHHAGELQKLPVLGHDGSNLQWPLLIRLYYLGNSKNGVYRGALPAKVESRLLEHYFTIVSRASTIIPYDENAADVADDAVGTWRWATSSENHIVTKQSSRLLMLQALYNEPTFRNRTLENKETVATSYGRWLKHWHLYIDERLKHGPLVEVGAITYSKYTLAGIMNLIDFPDDTTLREKARNWADIIFATAAAETLSNGVRAGSKSRKFTLTDIAREPYGRFYSKLYLEPSDRSPGENQLSPIFLTSSYFPASVVTKLWKNAATSSAYELHARAPGVVFNNSRHIDPSRAVYQYTYMTPTYAMGSAILNYSQEQYAAASSESRTPWIAMNEGSGAGAPYISLAPGASQCFDRALTVQHKNVMIVQNNIPFWTEGHERCFGTPAGNPNEYLSTARNGVSISYPVAGKWISSDNLDTSLHHVDVLFSANLPVVQDNGALFLTSPDGKTYTWIKAVAGGFRVMDGYDLEKGTRDDDHPTKNAYLDTDKFAPYVVISTPAANYRNQLWLFQTEMNHMSRISYANGVVTVQAPLRTQLEPNDIFVDSERAVTTGNWGVVNGRGEHEKSSLRADSTENTTLTLNFTVKKAGRYYVRARVGAVPGSQFLVSLNRRAFVPWKFAQVARSWEPVPVFPDDNQVFLSAGDHTITIKAAETGAVFDALALFYERDVTLSTLQYTENLNRTQPGPTLNGVALHSRPEFTKYAFKSPYVSSLKDSGSWLIQYGDEAITLGLAARKSVVAMEAEAAIGLSSAEIKTEADGARFVELSEKGTKSLSYEINLPEAGRYMLYGRTRGYNGKSNSFTVVVGGTSTVWTFPRTGEWTWNFMQSRSPTKSVLSLPAGKITLSIELRESQSQIDSFKLIPVH